MLYDVVLSSFNVDEIMIIDLCMTLCNMEATQAYEAVDNMPYTLVAGVDIKEAKRIKKAFEYEGAFIDIISANMDNNNNNNNTNQSAIISDKDVEQHINEENSIDCFNNELCNDEDDYEEGINLEKVFEENVNINMTPNDYGDYALEKFEQSDDNNEEEIEGRKLKELFDEFVEDTTDFSNCTYNSNDKPAYNEINKPRKKYISKEDIIKIERERNNSVYEKNNKVDTFKTEFHENEKKNQSNKTYITKDYVKEGYKQEIISSDDNNFLNLGNSTYDEDCMQINTQKRDNDIESSEDDMKNLYNKKALNNMKQSENNKIDNQWIDALKKSNSKNNAHNTNLFQKEQIMCPKCGSVFVSCKKSQGFFGTGKIKYICEACRHKF